YAGAVYKKTDSPHPLLHKELRLLRDKICADADIPVFFVAGTKTLEEMAQYLPQTPDELEKINGFGKAKIQKFGQEFLDVILKYSAANNLSSNIQEKIPKKEKKEKSKAAKVDTKLQSFNLYKEGKSVQEIAAERNFTVQTIEGHLAHYISLGEIKIEELVAREKIILIEPVLQNFDGGSITPIKQQLGDDVSFGEIRLVLAWKEFEKNKVAG
ncbi:MAG TPA: helix-turn-helix domain-containing protein, partial [Chitinophagaceae bacterium]|nr:helix-turn-helix domain-containing protein [Chitinophagaceae bacterium]